MAADNDPRIPRQRETRLSLLRRGLIRLAGIDPETGSPRRRVARLADIPEEGFPSSIFLSSNVSYPLIGSP